MSKLFALAVISTLPVLSRELCEGLAHGWHVLYYRQPMFYQSHQRIWAVSSGFCLTDARETGHMMVQCWLSCTDFILCLRCFNCFRDKCQENNPHFAEADRLEVIRCVRVCVSDSCGPRGSDLWSGWLWTLKGQCVCPNVCVCLCVCERELWQGPPSGSDKTGHLLLLCLALC